MKLPKRPGEVVGNGCHADQRGMQTNDKRTAA